jgi:Transcriptional Coactivator p15 (PC4)
MTAPALPLVVAEIEKNARERFRVTIDSFKGTNVIDLRTFFVDGENVRPTRSGLATSIRHLPALAKAMNDALDRARELGLVRE